MCSAGVGCVHAFVPAYGSHSCDPAGRSNIAKDTPLWAETKDKLNLSGILNVLDGVVDAPNRLLVMTTNHPEKLDPALIRPGRVDKKFHLSYLVGEQAVRMAAHYFQEELEGEAAAQVCQLVDGVTEYSIVLYIILEYSIV